MNFLKKITTNISLFFTKIYLFIIKVFVEPLKDKILLKRIFFTFFMMIIFVIVGTVTLPGIKINESNSLESNSEFLSLLNTIGGGGLRQFSLVSLGISPFVTASLVMTFAQTKLIPPLHRLSQSGPVGRIKLNYITHGLTFFFGIIQAIIIIQTLTNQKTPQASFASISESYNQPWFIWMVLPFLLVAGCFFSIFISEQITNKGVGNGTSMLILAGSIITLPNFFTNAYNYWIASKTDQMLFKGIIYFISFIVAFIVLMFIASFFYQAERRIPIQHTGAGRSKNIKDISYLPIKINPAGIMPLIFASMLITFPMMIVNLVDEIDPNYVTIWMKNNFSLTSWIGITIFAVSTFVITIFLSLQQSRIDKIVEDFNKNSTFIPGIRPGEQTEDYLTSIVLRLSFFSAIYLTIFGTMSYFAAALGANQNLIISGTTIMIIVSVSIETIQQIEARYKSEHIFRTNTKKHLQEQVDKNNISLDLEIDEDEIASSDDSILW